MNYEDSDENIADALDDAFDYVNDLCKEYLIRLVKETLTKEQKEHIITEYNSFRERKLREYF